MARKYTTEEERITARRAAYLRYYYKTFPNQQARKRRWEAENPERHAEATRKRRLKDRKRVLEHYGNCCVCCGERTYEFLAVDHKNNDGANHRRLIKGDNLCRWIIRNNFPDTFQILCHNCNCAKAWYGICPHQRSGLSARQ